MALPGFRGRVAPVISVFAPEIAVVSRGNSHLQPLEPGGSAGSEFLTGGIIQLSLPIAVVSQKGAAGDRVLGDHSLIGGGNDRRSPVTAQEAEQGPGKRPGPGEGGGQKAAVAALLPLQTPLPGRLRRVAVQGEEVDENPLVNGKVPGRRFQEEGAGEAELAVDGGKGRVGFIILKKNVPGEEGWSLRQKYFVIGP